MFVLIGASVAVRARKELSLRMSAQHSLLPAYIMPSAGERVTGSQQPGEAGAL